MNTSYEKSKQTTDEWYTPPYIYSQLGVFDLDPCAAINPVFSIAKTNFTKFDDGLSKEWTGRVWLNPPYSRPLLERFVSKLATHGNGIALLFNRCDCKLFQDVVFEKAQGIKFIKGRIRFIKSDGKEGGTPGCGSVLIAFGKKNAKVLEESAIPGKYFDITNNKISDEYFRF